MSVQETPLTPAEIYEKINGGPGLGPLRDSQDTLSQLRRLMENSAADVRALNSKISEGFQGAAGRAAANATRPLSKATEDDLDHLAKVDGSVSAQVTAFSIVQNSVQPVSAQPPRMTKRDTIDLIFGASGGFEQKFSAWVAAGQANIQAFSAYYDASTADKQNAPSQFGQVVDPGSQVDMTRSGSPGIAGPVTPAAGPGKPTGGHGNYSPTPKPVALEPSPVQPTSSVGNTGTPSTSPTENDGTSAATYTPSSGTFRRATSSARRVRSTREPTRISRAATARNMEFPAITWAPEHSTR